MVNNIIAIPVPQETIIEKNAGEEYRISVSDFKGYKLLKCHVWWRNSEGEMKPGKANLTVRVEKARSVLSAMEKALSDAGF